MKMDEQELMRRIQGGDDAAFEEIVTMYKNRIVNYIYRLTGDYKRAVELSQETFMRVYFKANRWKPVAPLSSWIYAIAGNLAKTDLKKRRRAVQMPLDDLHDQVSSGVALREDPVMNSMVKRMRTALGTLHPRYRIPIILKDIEGFTQEEIAEMLKKPVGTIKARISRGRGYLRQAMEKSSTSIKFATENRELENGRV